MVGEQAFRAEFLAAAGYDYGQGYYYSAALPAAECAVWIACFNAAGSGGVSRVA